MSDYITLRVTGTVINNGSSSSGGDIVLRVTATGEIPSGGSGEITLRVTASSDDTNNQGGQSETGGGNGDFNNNTDTIPLPELPDISGTGSGLVTLFRPSRQELLDLGSYLWTNILDFIENLQKLFTNPMDYMIALNIFPVVPSVGSSRGIKIGNLLTPITMQPVNSQWYQFDCGTVQLTEYWGSALDYAPNTKVSAMLPFIGSVTLSTDEVMNHTIGLRYNIDLLSGACVALITVDGSVYYQFTGDCSVAVPLTGSDWSRVYSAVLGAVGTAITGGIAATAAGSAAGGAMRGLVNQTNAANAVGNVGLAYSMLNDTSKGVRGVQQMRQDLAAASAMALESGRQAASASDAVTSGIRSVRLANTVNNTVQQVMGGKHFVSHSGAVSGSAAMLGVKQAYLLVEYPRQSLPDNYKHFVGYPSNMYAQLKRLSGYTECEQVIADGIGAATDTEMSEIIEALKGGVYL